MVSRWDFYVTCWQFKNDGFDPFCFLDPSDPCVKISKPL